MSFLAALLLVSIPAAAPAAAPAPAPIAPRLAPAEDGDRLSLEELLAKYRQRRDGLLAGYRAEISEVLAAIEDAFETGRKSGLPKLRTRLVRLGPEATPLLVLELDPGSKASEIKQQRAQQVGLVLSELSTRNATVELIKVFEKGSTAGQVNALRVLSHSDDPERVGPVLRARFAEVDGDMRARVIASIAILGGDENFTFIGDVLGSKDPAIVKSALRALADNKCTAAAPKILDLVQAHIAAAAHVPDIVNYYRSCPDVVDKDHCTALVNLAVALKSNSKMAEKVLEILGEHEDEWDSKVKKQIKGLAGASSNRIAEAAQVCLARAGDRSMKKKLLAPYDSVIQANDRIASSWQRRAEIKMKIGEYKSAIKDFLEAQSLSENFRRSEPDIYIGIARAYARLRKPKDAAKWLDQGSLNISQLHLLSRDPDFAALLEDDNLRKVFRLEGK